MFKITIHMVSSLDDYIAKEDQDLSWMHSSDQYEGGKTLTENEISDFLNSVDCYMMGSKTYEAALTHGWPYGDTPVIVCTKRKLSSDRDSVSFSDLGLPQLVEKELRPHYQNVWMVGGSILTKKFIQLGLAHEIVISIIPVILGSGTLFFDHIGKQLQLHLKESTTYSDGMVELTYEFIKESENSPL